MPAAGDRQSGRDGLGDGRRWAHLKRERDIGLCAVCLVLARHKLRHLWVRRDALRFLCPLQPLNHACTCARRYSLESVSTAWSNLRKRAAHMACASVLDAVIHADTEWTEAVRRHSRGTCGPCAGSQAYACPVGAKVGSRVSLRAVNPMDCYKYRQVSEYAARTG